MRSIEWLPIDQAPKNGTTVLLWRGNWPTPGPAVARWFEPWGVWLREGDPTPLPEEIDEIEIYGIGAAIPTHFAYIFSPKEACDLK